MSRVFYTNTQQDQISRVIPDLIRARRLLWDLISKEQRARYRNAMIGFIWAVLHPLLMMLILTLVFGLVFRDRAGDRVPASAGMLAGKGMAVYILCGLVFWQFLAAALGRATHSLVENSDLIRKVYFPREVIPLAAIGNCLVNLCIGFVVLVIVHLCWGGTLGLGIVWMAPVFGIQLVFVTGLALLLSSLNVHFRDIGYMAEVALAFGFYATPVFYPVELVRRFAWYPMYAANPMVGLVTAYRQALLENHMPDLTLLAWPALASVAVLILGVVVFRRNAPVIADFV